MEGILSKSTRQLNQGESVKGETLFYPYCGMDLMLPRYFAYRDSFLKKCFSELLILAIVSILRSSLLELARTKRVFSFGRDFNCHFAIQRISSLQLGIFSLQQTNSIQIIYLLG